MVKNILLASLFAASLAGCMATPTERGLAGAVVGAAIADATDNNMVAGAALGGLAGAASCGLPGLPRCY
jgi:osmotically inducible lipoprotein OsmB